MTSLAQSIMPVSGLVVLLNSTSIAELAGGPENLADMVHQARNGRLLGCSALALYVYHYLLTLGDEVELIWPSKPSALKYAFLVQRYMPFFDGSGFATIQSFTGVDLAICQYSHWITSFLFCIGMTMSEAILSLRIWSLWMRSRTLGNLLVAFYTILGCVMSVSLVIYLQSAKYITLPLAHMSCLFVANRMTVSMCWTMLVSNDVIMSALMTVGVTRNWSFGQRSNLLKTIYRDGVAYYVCLSVLGIANIILVNMAPAYVGFIMLSPYERVAHVLVANRVIFDLRREAIRNGGDNDHMQSDGENITTEFNVNSLRFAVSTSISHIQSVRPSEHVTHDLRALNRRGV